MGKISIIPSEIHDVFVFRLLCYESGEDAEEKRQPSRDVVKKHLIYSSQSDTGDCQRFGFWLEVAWESCGGRLLEYIQIDEGQATSDPGCYIVIFALSSPPI